MNLTNQFYQPIKSTKNLCNHISCGSVINSKVSSKLKTFMYFKSVLTSFKGTAL